MPKVTIFYTRTQEFEQEFDVPANMITGEWPDEELTEEGWDFVRERATFEDCWDEYVKFSDGIVNVDG